MTHHASASKKAISAHDVPSNDNTASSAPNPRDPHAYRVIERLEPAQLRSFALFRASPQGLPQHVRHVLRSPMFGMNWNLARRIPVTLPGEYWLVPGNHYVCVVSQQNQAEAGIGTTCSKTTEALEHGIASITIARNVPGSGVIPGREIVGVASDGSQEVAVSTHGHTEIAPVVDEVFVLHDAAASPPDSMIVR